MTSVVVMLMRGAPENLLSRTLTAPRVPNIPRAPSCALTLHRAYYSSYEKKRPKERGSVHFDCAAEAQREFLVGHVYPHIAQREKEGEFATFLHEIGEYDIDTPVAAPAAAPAAANASACDGSTAQP